MADPLAQRASDIKLVAGVGGQVKTLEDVETAMVIDSRVAALRLSSIYLTARKILRSARRGIAPIQTVMASPPTRTEGTSGAASTINGNAISAPRIGPPGTTGAPFLEAIGIYTNNVDLTTSYIGAGIRRMAHGSGIRFLTDASAFEIAIGGGAVNGQPYALYVTDMATGIRARVAANDPTVTVTSAHYDKWDFGSAALRLIEIYHGFNASGNVAINGINMAATAMICRAPNPDDPRVLWLGDSWGDTGGSQNTNPTSLLAPDFFGEILGVANVLSASYGGTGFLNRAGSGSSAKGTYLERIVNGDIDVSRISAADLIVLPGSINDDVSNDAAFTDAAVTAAVTATVQAAFARQPTALIVGFGPQVTRSYATTQARFDAYKAGWVAAGASVVAKGVVITVGSNPNLLYVDNSPAAENWLFGTSATGNVSTYFNGTDTNHLLDFGQASWGRRVGRSVAAAIQAAYA